jgi:hypothetical protein
MKVVRLSALRTGRLYPQELFLVLISVKRLSQPQGHSAAGRVVNEKFQWHHRKMFYLFLIYSCCTGVQGNRTRDRPACSTVPQPTVPPRAPINAVYNYYIPNKALLEECDKNRMWQ